MKLIIPNFWRSKNLLSFLLLPISWIYQFMSTKVSYVPKSKVYKAKAQIITIGNVTIGGGGKTPVTISIAKILNNYTRSKFAILTKGYKGKLKGPIIVNPEHNIDEVGDEALLLSKDFTTCVAKDRLSGIKYLESLGYEVIITDDGLHDQRFKRNLTLMVVDTNFGFGNQEIIPAGPLRETILSGLKKTDLVVLIGSEKLDYKFPVNTVILKANLVSKVLLQNKKFIAFAGIGNPKKFFNSVKEAEGELVEKIAFADHHHYNKKDMERLLKLKQESEAELITTEKDYVRIDDDYKSQIRVLPVNIVWKDENTLLSKLLNL